MSSYGEVKKLFGQYESDGLDRHIQNQARQIPTLVNGYDVETLKKTDIAQVSKMILDKLNLNPINTAGKTQMLIKEHEYYGGIEVKYTMKIAGSADLLLHTPSILTPYHDVRSTTVGGKEFECKVCHWKGNSVIIEEEVRFGAKKASPRLEVCPNCAAQISNGTVDLQAVYSSIPYANIGYGEISLVSSYSDPVPTKGQLTLLGHYYLKAVNLVMAEVNREIEAQRPNQIKTIDETIKTRLDRLKRIGK